MLIHKKTVSVILLILGLSFSGSSYANAENSSNDEGNFILDTLRMATLLRIDDKGNPISPILASPLSLAELVAGRVLLLESQSVDKKKVKKNIAKNLRLTHFQIENIEPSKLDEYTQQTKRSSISKLYRVVGGTLIIHGLLSLGDTIYLVMRKERK